jgi:DNA-binding protein H-NS
MAKIDLSRMNVQSLLDLRREVDNRLRDHRVALERQIAQISPRGAGSGTKGRKVAPKYRSKADPNQTWAGRGAIPRWMRDEMKVRKLKKEAFLIK